MRLTEWGVSGCAHGFTKTKRGGQKLHSRGNLSYCAFRCARNPVIRAFCQNYRNYETLSMKPFLCLMVACRLGPHRGKAEGTIIRPPRVLLVVLTRRKGNKAAIVILVKFAQVTTPKKRKTVERDRSIPKVDLLTV